MADVHDTTTRSYNMSRIRSKDTKPEIVLRKALFAAGFRYRLHDRKLPGKPDIVLKKYKTAIFVHGCFWHGHKNCKYCVIPKTRTEWWLKKISTNQRNDALHKQLLIKNGWSVIEVFECALKKRKLTQTILKIEKKLRNHKADHNTRNTKADKKYE